jgi:hypothetical protein
MRELVDLPVAPLRPVRAAPVVMEFAPHSTAGEIRSEFAEIVRAYEHVYTVLENYSYRYTCLGKPLISPEAMKQVDLVHVPALDGEVIATTDRLYRKHIRPIMREEAKRDTGIEAWAFDGEFFSHRGPERFVDRGVIRGRGYEGLG